MVEFRPARAEDADDLAQRLRAADVAELCAVHGPGVSLSGVLRQAMRLAPNSVAAVDGRVIALLGCAPAGTLLTRFGVPWLLGSDECDRHPRVFLAAGRRQVAKWLDEFGALANWTDDRHQSSHRLLRHLGFSLEDPRPYGAAGLPFRRFHLRCT